MLSLIVKSLVSPQKYFNVKIPTWLARQQATGSGPNHNIVERIR